MNPQWTIYAKKIATLETQFVPKVRKALQAQIQLFVSDLQEQGKDLALSNLQQQFLAGEMRNIIEQVYTKAGAMGARLTYSELKAQVKEGQKAAGFGRNAEWVREVLEYLKLHGIEFVQNISDTTREFILKILQKGIEENQSIAEIVKQLTRSDYTQARARTIARTEIVRAANVGHAIGARSLPYEVNKKWIAADDHRTRHAHHMVHKMVIGEDDLFKVPVYRGDVLVGHEDMTAPGDAKASPSNTINCRCRITHEAKRDAQGNLIPRAANQARIIPLRTSTVQTGDIMEAIRASIKMIVEH